jgi:hypothetical protein
MALPPQKVILDRSGCLGYNLVILRGKEARQLMKSILVVVTTQFGASPAEAI